MTSIRRLLARLYCGLFGDHDRETIIEPSHEVTICRRGCGHRRVSRVSLTPRQVAVLKAAAEGLGIKQTSALLELSTRQVYRARRDAFAKLGMEPGDGSIGRAVWVARDLLAPINGTKP